MQESILWIDNDLSMLSFVTEALVLEGYRVDIASSNRAALDLLSTNAPYDLVIQDVMRPPGILQDDPEVAHGRYSGLVFFKRFLAEHTHRTPVLFFSVSAGDDRLGELLSEYPRARVLNKMIGIGDFVKEVRDMLDDTGDELLFQAQVPAAPTIVRVDFQKVNRLLMQHLARNPGEIHQLTPRKFEELVARLLEEQGYDVELTPETRDGGVDILAVRRADLVENLYLVECKRFAEGSPVGIGYVQRLFGVKQATGATAGILVTSSFYSAPARVFQSKHKYDISLKDSQDLRDWLQALA